MSADSDGRSLTDAAELRVLHVERARAEFAEADRLCPGSDVVPASGDPLAQVLLLKGLPGPAEAAGASALEGADGEAVAKALGALGWSPDQSFRMLTRPQKDLDPARCAARVRTMVEAVDPRVVLALDDEAAEDLARAFEVAPLRPGNEVVVAGRRLVAIDGFEAALSDPVRKKVVWRQLKVAAPRGPSY